MSAANETPTTPPQGAAEPAPTVKGADSTPPAGIERSPAERPEALVGAAFAGGFLLALLLKRRGD